MQVHAIARAKVPVGCGRLEIAGRPMLEAEYPEGDTEKSLREVISALKQHTVCLERELARVKKAYESPQITHDGLDPHPALDYMARLSWPSISSDPDVSDRRVAAEYLLCAAYSDDVRKNAPQAAVIASRQAAAMMGNDFCEKWAKDNSDLLMKPDLKALYRRISSMMR